MSQIKRWYVVYTQPRQEARAEANLRRQSFEAWSPSVRRVRRHARRAESVLAPLFPRYLFVRLDQASHTGRSINGTFGVAHLLCNGDTPLPVPAGLVEEIMERCDETGAIIGSPRPLVAGEKVTVATGRFDLEGLFEARSGQDRVVLLVSMLGREVRASVPLRGLAA
jgi:transcriptional antiterminator RfaH